jgi:hypothetical protein
VVRKELPGLLITPRVGQLGVLGGVLNILVPHPILHKLEFAAGVEEVSGDGMFETMELPLLRWEAGFFTVCLHRAP